MGGPAVPVPKVSFPDTARPAGDALTPLMLALMVATPAATDVANPVLEIVAMPVGEDCQDTLSVKSCVLPSLYDPVAVN